MTANITKQKVESIAGRILENASKLRYGQVAVIMKIHDRQITEITYQVTESTRENDGS
jgi:hypothetical protein